MESIKPLGDAVRSSLRSGFIISSLTSIVEELVYNSLDAGATKISVSVGVSTGYVKAEDDGSGISRDGLVLLGDRYATSKVRHLGTKDAGCGSFGFHGEALCSIADLCLIEIVTKANGMPNGYRKVLKGSNCLYLGINDRQQVGTTVTVRDLFYNQPVRRRQMQSSPKKELHSVKKCVLRISLVQPKVSFKVMDVESEDELLRTRAPSCLLSALSANFGIDASNLHELSVSEGQLRLSGYISSPCHSSISKAIQYIYINSRFVVKGPIHKLLNRLASTFWDQLIDHKVQNGNLPQVRPTYCLNLTCPCSYYDLCLEQSRTYVEFKDWVPVLAFIEKSVTSLWSRKASNEFFSCAADIVGGDNIKDIADLASVEEDELEMHKFPRKRSRMNNNEKQLSAFGDSSFLMRGQVEDSERASIRQSIHTSPGLSRKNSVETKKPEVVNVSSHQMDSVRSAGASFSSFTFDIKDNGDDILWEPNDKLTSVNEDLWEHNISTTKRHDSDGEDYMFTPRWKDECLRSVDAIAESSDAAGSLRACLHFDHERKIESRSSLENCSSWRNLRDKRPKFQIDDYQTENICRTSEGNPDATKFNGVCQKFGKFDQMLWSDEVANTWSSAEIDAESNVAEDFGFTLRKCQNSPFYDVMSDGKQRTHDFSKQVGVFGSSCHVSISDAHSMISDPLLDTNTWDPELFIYDKAVRGDYVSERHANFDEFGDQREDFQSDSTDEWFGCEKFASPRLSSRLTYKSNHAIARHGMSEVSSHSHSIEGLSSKRHDEMMANEPLSCLNLIGGNHRHWSLSVLQDPSTSVQGEPIMDLRRVQACGSVRNLGESLERSHRGLSPIGISHARCDDFLDDEIYSPSNFHDKEHLCSPSKVCHSPLTSIDRGSPKIDLQRYQSFDPNTSRERPRSRARAGRSHSAPPIYKGRRRFFSINYVSATTENYAMQVASDTCPITGRGKFEHPSLLQQVSCEDHGYPVTSSAEDTSFFIEAKIKDSNIAQDGVKTQMENKAENVYGNRGNYLMQVKEPESPPVKWRAGCPVTRPEDLVKFQMGVDKSKKSQDEHMILDISCCMLNLAGETLVPKSINRSWLENASVLPQVDSKFIPVVAGGTLAVIDQHAADERIRLEEMREKVLSGEMKSVTYLEAEKELVLPETAYQLLYNYAEHIQNWGWICNIHGQKVGSFTKNLSLLNGQPNGVILVAVPCILGVNLSDSDLLEYLEQLADTDGSSTMPPSVLRILNYKACRGAIMFGDKLLPSECCLIVEELRRTSLCFQCAHGRPTTVPLVNLEALHKQIAQLGTWNEGPNTPWHGLCRQEISLERANQRLNVARGGG